MPPTGLGSAYHTNYQSLSQPVPPPGYDIPPLEGYYSPDRISGSFSPELVNGQRPLPSVMQNPTQYVGPPLQYPTENQQSYYQPQSPWVRNLMSHSPTPNPRTYPGQNSSRDVPNYHNEYRISSDVPPSNELRSSRPYQTSQPPTQSYRSQNEPSIAMIPPHNASIVRESPGYHEAPPVRYDSPPPPPPPPKDDHLLPGSRSRHGRSLSQVPPPTQYSPSVPRQASAQTRQSLPPLQTNMGKSKAAAASTPMTPEDVRRARQQQIERSGRTPQAQVRNDASVAMYDPEEIVMSSSSYPGQEWQPSYGNWHGD